MPYVDWDRQFKLRTTDCRKERDKHEVCKLLLLRKLIRKHTSEKQYIKVYTEFNVHEGVICDIYFENYKTREKYCFEIQKDMTKVKQKQEAYKDWSDLFFTTDLIIIDLNKLSNDIDEMEEQLGVFVV